jgi:transposase
MSTPSKHKPSAEQASFLDDPAGEEARPSPPAGGRGRPRVRTANRGQVVYRAVPLDALIPDDHPARVVWAYVEGLDLAPLYDAIGSVAGRAGRPAADPRLLLALWIYATSEGVGSARELDRLRRDHVAYQWIAGDVSTNHHSLADFRVAHVELLDELLTRSIAALLAEGLIDLARVAQDGMRVRASAGAASFRRRPTLEEALADARAQVDALKAEADGDPAAADRRRKAARERAARERAERVAAALARLPEMEARKPAGERPRARCSTTDPDATVMKMADGGFRPAYNVQFAADAGGLVVVGVDVVVAGSDAGLMAPMAAQIVARAGRAPAEFLVDGGFAQHDQIAAASAPGLDCTVYAPVPAPRDPKVDRHEPKPGDGPAVAAWRRRMATPEAKAIYKDRAATAECVNAQARGRGLIQLPVRGLAKAKAIALWHALTHNVFRAASLRVAAASR